MTKKKRKPAHLAKKKFSYLHIFICGLIVGAALSTLNLDTEFKTAKLKSPPASAFSSHLPTTSIVLEREGYTLAYEGRTRNPYWVYHRLTPKVDEKQATRDLCDFQEDHAIPSPIRATKSDYKNSGYDRGHLFPAADSKNQLEMDESFLLTNISPQVPAFNRGYWRKLEGHIRELTEKYPLVHVFAGPLYLKQKEEDGKQYVKYEVIGNHDVAVPTHFFSLIFVEQTNGKLRTKGYILPNKQISSKIPFKKFSASIEEIETASGIIFSKTHG